MAEQTANKNRIIEVLRNFNIEISSIKATVGPTITLYEITPAQGVRIAKIRNLEDDIALSLKALGIRIIAPIPGKGTIGIEVPNAKPNIVSMESILNSKKFQESEMELPCAVGKTITNEVFMFDLAKIPHLLVAGATGQGKSVGLNAILTSLLYKKHPAELKIVLIDPKKVEFSIYGPIANHFLAKVPDEDAEPIITDVTKVVRTLNSLCKEMDTRYDLLKSAGTRNIKEYNKKFVSRMLNPENGHRYMPYIVVVIDEFGDLIMTAGKEIEMPIARIAQLARAVGIHMIIATQRPTTTIITGNIKANFNPFKDSMKIFFILLLAFLRFVFSSLTSCIIDLAFFQIFCWILAPHTIVYTLPATILARIISATYNFTVNYKIVFKSEGNVLKALARFAGLAVTWMFLSAGLVTGGNLLLPWMPDIIIKMIVDTSLFFVSFKLQQKFVFGKGGKKNDDL